MGNGRKLRREKLTDIRLRWVLADPARERAVDPLGMGAQADQIADRLLPDLSVQTSRARYLSFLCWAVQKSQGAFSGIHRLEAKLALEEARRHRSDSNNGCAYIGSRSAQSYLETHDWKNPARPERLYKNTAFVRYRPLMRALGLLRSERAAELKPVGAKLARFFERSRERKPCLSRISPKERVEIRVLLGLDRRSQSKLTPKALRRFRTYEVIRRLLKRDYDSAMILETHAKLGTRRTDVTTELHRAFIWEILSCGLALAFFMLLAEQRTKPVIRKLRAALNRRTRRPRLRDFNANDPESAQQVVALLRAALQMHPDKFGLNPEPVELAKLLLHQRKPESFIHGVVELHRQAKAGTSWIALAGDRLQVLAPTKTLVLKVQPRTYRLDAFSQLIRDLGMTR